MGRECDDGLERRIVDLLSSFTIPNLDLPVLPPRHLPFCRHAGKTLPKKFCPRHYPCLFMSSLSHKTSILSP